MKILVIVHCIRRLEVRALLTDNPIVFKFHNKDMSKLDKGCELWDEMDKFFFSEKLGWLFPGHERVDLKFQLLSVMKDINSFDYLVFCEV